MRARRSSGGGSRLLAGADRWLGGGDDVGVAVRDGAVPAMVFHTDSKYERAGGPGRHDPHSGGRARMVVPRCSPGRAHPGWDLSPGSRGLADQMGDLASIMWRRAADAWYRRDRSAAAATGERAIESCGNRSCSCASG